MKKFFSLVLALVMALSLTTAAWGAAPVMNETELKAALATGGDVVLGANITIANTTGTSDWAVVGYGKTVTLDLAGYTITRTANDTLGAIRVLGELIVNDSSTNKTGGISGGDYAIVVGWKGYEGNGAKLTINGGTFTGGGYAITGNGTVPTGNNTTNWGTDITINGGTITGTEVGIYHPQVGTLTINGGTIKGATGVEVRGGTLEITGGDISATSNTYRSVANGNGATSTGVAVAVAQHTTKQAIDVTISGGELSGVKAFAEENPEQNTAPAVTIDITDGEFDGDVLVTDDQSTEISGGTFYGAVDEDLLADDVILSAGGGVVTVPNAAIPSGGPTLALDVKDIADAEYASWKAVVTAKDSENAKKYEFATYTIEMIAKVDGAPIWWNNDGNEDKGEDVDFTWLGEKEFIKTTASAADFVVVDGKNITYFAIAEPYNDDNYAGGWDEKATQVTLPVRVAGKEECDTSYATPAFFAVSGGVVYEFDGDYYVASTYNNMDILFNVGGVAVPAEEATAAEVYYHDHVYKFDSKGNSYGERELTKVYCGVCKDDFKFVVGSSELAIRTFGANGYNTLTETWNGKAVYVEKKATNNGYTGEIIIGGGATTPDTDKVTSADTFDAGIAMYVGMSVMAAAGSAVVIGKKRED